MFSADKVARTYLKQGHCERKYLAGVLSELESLFLKMPSAPDLEVYIHGHLEGVPKTVDLSRTIVLSLSEEKRLIPEYFSRAVVVFKQHAPYLRFTKFGLLGFRPANVFALPLGYDSNVPWFPAKPIEDRTIDVFFSGSNWPSRRRFFRATELLAANSPWRVEVGATDGFHTGLTPDEYGRKLAETKIALCPKGFVSSESFRLYEAMRAGCIVVTVRQPKSWYRQGWPVVEIGNWKSLGRVVDRLLKEPDSLRRLQNESIRWWNEKCSERAVANFIGRTSLKRRSPRPLLAIEEVLAAVIRFAYSIEAKCASGVKGLVR